MLGLLEATNPAWVEMAASRLDELLSDHAHCELKAAQNALSLVARFGGEAPELVAPLTALAQEEAEHFRQVHGALEARHVKLAPPARDDYVVALQQAAKLDHPAVPILLDRLLIAALIEARSCERFKLLADHLDDPGLAAFYRELMASEARHHRLFAELAESRFGLEAARTRLGELARREAAIVRNLPLTPTVHG